MALTTIDDRGLKTPIDLLDNEKIRLGTGNDLELYHNGTNSYIKDTGTGELIIESTAGGVRFNSSSNATGLLFNPNTSIELYYNNAKKFETTSAGVNVSGHLDLNSDTGRLKLGAGDDLSLYHDGSNSYIVNTGGDLRIWSKTDEYAITAAPDGAVELYHDGSKKFETTTHGIQVQGAEGQNAELLLYADEGDDNADKWRLKVDTNGQLEINNYASGSYEKNIECNGNGNVELYYDGSKKLETTSGGVSITGNLGIGGTPGDYDAEADNFVVASSDHTGVTIASTGTDKRTNLYFADGTSGNAQYRGAFTYDHSDDSLRVRTAGAERLRIDSPGRLLLGTTTEGYTMSDNLTVYEDGDCGITIRSGTTNYGRIDFSRGTSGSDEYKGVIEYHHNTDTLTFKSSATTALTINSSQNATFAGTVSDSKGNVRRIIETVHSSAHTLVSADAGKYINISTGGLTIPINQFADGDCVSMINNSSSDQTITCSAVTMYLAGDTSLKTSLTLSGRGVCTFICVGGNVFYGSGVGLS